MAFTVRNTNSSKLGVLVSAWNAKQRAAISTNFHYDATQTTTGSFDAHVATTVAITSANGTNITTALVLVNEIKHKLNYHLVDSLAHTLPDTAITTADATDLTSANTLANAIKTKYNTGGHINSTTIHLNTDATNTIAAAAATDQTTLDTLINELKTDITAHIASAPSGSMINVTPA